MALKLQQHQLRDIGEKLGSPPASKDALIKLLKQAANCLSEIEQSPLPSMLDAMRPCINAVATQGLLKHEDRDVKVLVAVCICEITRINVIYDVYQCGPQILHGIIPYITGELPADALDVRLKAVQLLGELFALPGLSISESFQSLFSEFLKRLTDRVVEVRVSVIGHLKNCLISNPSRPEASSIIKALCDRLLDYNENVREQVVAAICDNACHSLKVVPAETIKLVAERLRDKSLSVKRLTLEKLADLYRFYCLKSANGSTSVDELEWIPGRMLRSLYDKDFRPEGIELILSGFLFPPEFSVNDRLKHWATAFSVLDKVEVKALEQVLVQKQRLQQEFQKYLSLRHTYQENAPELQKRVSVCFRNMSRLFSESTKAEEGFQILNQLKDANIWKMLTTLLDPCTSFPQAWSYRDDLLKILGEKHPLHDFVGMLSTKCSYLLFNRDYVKAILTVASAQKSAGDVQFISSCMSLLAIIACFSPHLLAGFEENLVNLLKEDDEIIKEGVAHVLSKAGGTIREQLATKSSSVDLLLERLCLEGTRKQAKYSVHALAAITKDDGLKSLSVLYKRLVDILEERTHLPAILQALGCIAQIATPIFETREDEIFGFIKHKILECSNKLEEVSTLKSELNRTELCSLKIFGIKTLVKSYLPVRDAHQRPGIEKVIEILKNILSFGDISKDMESSAVDKAHMRLASAKAVLRLSRQWDHKIPLDVFYMTLRISEEVYAQSRKLFISKVQRYIKERLLDGKYACAFLLNISKFPSPEYTEGKRNLLEIIQVCQQAKVRQLSVQSDGNSTVAYPECILVYLVHALAHHPSFPSIDECKDVKVLEPLYWRLHLLLSLLLHGDEGGQSGGDPSKWETYIKVVSIFHSIKCLEDAADSAKSKVSHALCDLGLSIATRLVNDQSDISGIATSLTLPPTLYKPVKEGEKSADNNEQSWLGSESILAHFEALKLEDKELSVPGADKDEMILEEKDADGNEIPLGKMMKLLKSQGAKGKKKLKRRASPSDKRKPENEFDVLGVVREINLDNMKSEQSREIGELTKDSDSSESRRMSVDNSKERASVSRKWKESNGIAILNVSTPKRKRSANMHRSPKSAKGKNGSRILYYSRANRVDKKKGLSSVQKLMEDVESTNPDLLVSHLPTIKSTSSKNSVEPKSRKAIIKDEEKSAILGVTNMIGSSESSKGSLKKRKIRSISGLEKCSSHGIPLNNEELVGSRIKVWWPLDKAFYEGVVQSYDPGKKKYRILYDDEDVEVLNLSKEKWELIANSDSPNKHQNIQQSPSHKEMPLQKINKKSSPSSSRKKVNSAKKWQRKPAVKKHSELKGRNTSENYSHTDGSDAEGKGNSNLVNAHSHSGSEVDDVISDHDHKGKTPLEDENKTIAKSVESLKKSLHEKKSKPTSTRVEENSDE